MKLKYKSYLITLVTISTFFWSCQPEQEVEPIDSPDDNPVATIEPVGTISTSVNEGDTLMYMVSLESFIEMAVDWSTVIDDASTADITDIADGQGSILPYTKEGQVVLVIADDRFPEKSETLKAEINASEDIGYNWQLNPDSDSEMVDVTVNNVNSDDALTIGLRWANADDDWDLIIERPDESLSFAAATGNNPEVNEVTLTTDADDGEYLILVDPYEVSSSMTEFELNYSTPDGSVTENTVSFIEAESENYSKSQDYFIVGKVVKTGSNYVVDITL